MIHWLSNRLLLAPSRNTIDTGSKSRQTLPFYGGQIEGWGEGTKESPPDVVALKFIGMGGRAEYATLSPLDQWGDIVGQVWAFNPPGYGGSSGTADLRKLVAFAEACWKCIQEAFPTQKKILIGNSLGTALALYLAASFRPAGLILRNPPPMRELIRERSRYNWWNLGWGGNLIASQFPSHLDSIQNAAQCLAPALFIQSAADSLVPAEFQNRIIERFAGPKTVFQLPEAQHDTPLDEALHGDDYRLRLEWFREKTGI